MASYHKFRLNDNSTFRVKADKILATKSSPTNSVIDVYISGLSYPVHVPIQDKQDATAVLDKIWDRNSEPDFD